MDADRKKNITDIFIGVGLALAAVELLKFGVSKAAEKIEENRAKKQAQAGQSYDNPNERIS